jgi:hypothetical protein
MDCFGHARVWPACSARRGYPRVLAEDDGSQDGRQHLGGWRSWGNFARSHRGGTALLNIALRQRSSARDCVTVTRGFSLVHKQSHSRYHPVSRVVAPRRHPAHLAVLAARRRVHTNSRASPVGRRARRAGRLPSAAKRRASVLDAAIAQHCHPRTRSTSRRSLSLAQQFWYAPIPFCFNKPH